MNKLFIVLALLGATQHLDASAAPAKAQELEQIETALDAADLMLNQKARAEYLLNVAKKCDFEKYPKLALDLFAKMVSIDHEYRPLLSNIETAKGPRNLYRLCSIKDEKAENKQAQPDQQPQDPNSGTRFLALGRLVVEAFKANPVIGVLGAGFLAYGTYSWLNAPGETASSQNSPSTPTADQPKKPATPATITWIGPSVDAPPNPPANEEEKVRTAYAQLNLTAQTPWEQIRDSFQTRSAAIESAKAKAATGDDMREFDRLCQEAIQYYAAAQIVLGDQARKLEAQKTKPNEQSNLPPWRQTAGHSLRPETVLANVQTQLDPYQLLGLPYNATAVELQKAANDKIGLHLHALACAERDNNPDAALRQLNLIQLYLNAADQSAQEAALVRARLAAARIKAQEGKSIHEHKNQGTQT